MLFYYLTLTLTVFTETTLITVPSEPKVINILAYIFLFTLITPEKIYQAFIITVKTMVYFKTFSGHCTGKNVSLSNIYTHFTTRLLAFKWSNRPV